MAPRQWNDIAVPASSPSISFREMVEATPSDDAAQTFGNQPLRNIEFPDDTLNREAEERPKIARRKKSTGKASGTRKASGKGTVPPWWRNRKVAIAAGGGALFVLFGVIITIYGPNKDKVAEVRTTGNEPVSVTPSPGGSIDVRHVSDAPRAAASKAPGATAGLSAGELLFVPSCPVRCPRETALPRCRASSLRSAPLPGIGRWQIEASDRADKTAGWPGAPMASHVAVVGDSGQARVYDADTMRPDDHAHRPHRRPVQR